MATENTAAPRGHVLTLLVLAVFGLLLYVNTFAFRALLGLDYFAWYLKNTAPVFLGFAFISLAWGGLEKQTDLISADPRKFVRGYLVLCAGLSATLASILQPSRRSTHSLSIWDPLWTALWSLWLLAAVVVWLVVLGPIQYLLHLVTGAPARTMLDSDLKTWFITSENNQTILTAPAETPPTDGVVTEAGFFAKPVTLTTTLDSVAVFGLAWLVERLAN